MRTAHWVCWCVTSLSVAASAADLTESRFTQVINDVSVITPGTQTTAKALVNDLVRSPQLVRTGPASRAELLAQDQTLTRVGANTLFSFDPRGRTINLKQGSVLFHSPTGRGGGTIKTGGASAAVLGTTLMIVATPNGGFKGIVLEGKGKFTLPNGESRNLKAGQLLFVLPGSRAFGPTLNINLGKMVEGSGLVKGYTTELASMPKVQSAVSVQQGQISAGKMQDTGLLVGNNASKDTVTVIDPATFYAAVMENKTKAEKALKNDVDITGMTIPLDQVFPRSKFSKGIPWADILSYALLADDVTIASGETFIPPIGGRDFGDEETGVFGIIAKDKLSIAGDVDFRPTPVAGHPGYTPPGLALGADRLDIADGSTLRYLAPASLWIGAGQDVRLTGVKIEAQGGSLSLQSIGGDVTLQGGWLAAGQQEGDSVTVASRKGNVTLHDMALVGRTVQVSGKKVVDVRNVTFTMPGGASQLLPTSIAMQADTLVLANIDFPSSPVRLTSRVGALADNPNTRAPIMNGYVNFYENVTVNHHAAQDYIRSDANPTGNIRIMPLQP